MSPAVGQFCYLNFEPQHHKHFHMQTAVCLWPQYTLHETTFHVSGTWCTDCTEHWLKLQNSHSLREWMESHYDIRSSELFLFWNWLRYAFLLHLQSSFSQCLYKMPVRCPVSCPLPFGISSHTFSFLEWELRYLKRLFPLFQLLLGWQWIVLLHVNLNSINQSRWFTDFRQDLITWVWRQNVGWIL